MEEKSNLLQQAKQGDKKSFELLLQQHEKQLNYICSGFFLLDAEEDDLLQEARTAFWKAVIKYDPNASASFETYVTTVVKNHLINVIKQHNRKNAELLHNYISLNNQGALEVGEETGYMVASVENNTPETQLNQTSRLKELNQTIAKTLSQYEQTILQQYLADVLIADIAKNLQTQPKSIYNALQRIRSKLNFLNKTN